MFAFICSTFQFIMTLFYHDSSILVENLLLKKEVQILKRKLSLKRVRPSIFDRIWLSVLFSLNPSAVMNNMTLFSPRKVLSWQKRLIASFWTFTTHESHPGRPPASCVFLSKEHQNKVAFRWRNNALLPGGCVRN